MNNKILFWILSFLLVPLLVLGQENVTNTTAVNDVVSSNYILLLLVILFISFFAFGLFTGSSISFIVSSVTAIITLSFIISQDFAGKGLLITFWVALILVSIYEVFISMIQ